MRTKTQAGAAVLALGLALAGCSGQSTGATSAPAVSAPAASAMASSDAMAPAMTMLTGTFAGLNSKMVAGMVTISDGKLALSGFSSDEGPDLHIYLTNGTDEAAVSSGMELGKVAFNQASQTFKLASSFDVSKYTDVVIHCDKAKAVFGAASLS